ncbi:MAG TPA: hypothetical protein VFW94_04480 [Candidatus Acidoferrales bacterium]|nr:hypothetical protein [Candidatus Acidoferrales bacterium]
MNNDWIEHQRRRWMRNAAHLHVRHDAHRFAPPVSARSFYARDACWDPLGALERKYSPDQPRIPAGNPDGGQWTTGDAGSGVSIALPMGRLVANEIGAGESGAEEGPLVQVAGGSRSGGIRGGRYGGNFPGATYGQLIRLDLNVARTENTLTEIRRYDPNWQPRSESLISTSMDGVGSIEGEIRKSEARAEEAEAHLQQLRTGIGGNFGPPLDSESSPSTPAFDGQMWISMYRAANNMPDLFGNPTWPRDNGTVASADIDGKFYFGTNSGAPPYTHQDDISARQMRANLVSKYPTVMDTENLGRTPNDALFHAEATLLLRAARENGGTLAGKSIEIHTDREVCESCQTVLPYLAKELGSPTVMIVDPSDQKFLIP